MLTAAPLMTSSNSEGIKTVRTTHGVAWDLSLSVSADNNIILEAGNKHLFNATVQLSDLKFEGILRVTFALLTDKVIPGFKAITIGLVRKPIITFDLNAGQVSLTSIPGLEPIINTLIKDTLAASLVLPHTIPIPIYALSDQEREALKDFSGAAVLQVTVCNARFQPRDGSANKAFNTFVTCAVNSREEKKTDVKMGTRTPVNQLIVSCNR